MKEPQNMTDHEVALALSVAKDDTEMYEAEDQICERAGISLADTEMGFTQKATDAVEAWMSEQLGRPWTYAEVPAFAKEIGLERN